MDSNDGPLSFEATALPTEPQPLPDTYIHLRYITNIAGISYSSEKRERERERERENNIESKSISLLLLLVFVQL